MGWGDAFIRAQESAQDRLEREANAREMERRYNLEQQQAAEQRAWIRAQAERKDREDRNARFLNPLEAEIAKYPEALAGDPLYEYRDVPGRPGAKMKVRTGERESRANQAYTELRGMRAFEPLEESPRNVDLEGEVRAALARAAATRAQQAMQRARGNSSGLTYEERMALILGGKEADAVNKGAEFKPAPGAYITKDAQGNPIIAGYEDITAEQYDRALKAQEGIQGLLDKYGVRLPGGRGPMRRSTPGRTAAPPAQPAPAAANAPFVPKLKMISPDGLEIDVPTDQIGEAMQNGYKPKIVPGVR